MRTQLKNKKITKEYLIQELRLYSKSRANTSQTFTDGIRQNLIAKELHKYKVNWREL